MDHVKDTVRDLLQHGQANAQEVSAQLQKGAKDAIHQGQSWGHDLAGLLRKTKPYPKDWDLVESAFSKMDRNDYFTLIVAIAIPLVGGFLAAGMTMKDVKGWYTRIRKPTWTPPNALFGPVWTALYISMGIASWLVWRDGGFEKHPVPLGLYAASLVFNLMWQPIFFKLHKPTWALVDIFVVNILSAGVSYQFQDVIGLKLTGALLGPLLAWVAFATALNYSIVTLNSKSDRRVDASGTKEPLLQGATRTGAGAATATSGAH